MGAKILFGGLVATALLATGAAHAAPALPQGGPLYIQFNNLEQISTSNSIDNQSGGTEGNWGVFNVSSLQNGAVSIPNKDIAGGPTFFSDDGPGGVSGQIHGMFYGVNIINTTVAGPVITVDSDTGGFIDLYFTPAGSDTITAADLAGGFGPGNRTAVDQAGKFTSGDFLVRLEFASGIVDDDASVGIRGTFVNSITGSGFADSFANVVDVNNDGVIDGLDGQWAAALDADWFVVHDSAAAAGAGLTPETRDVRFSNFTNGLPSWNGAGDVIGLRSNDPARAFTVPEPSTVALLGIGLLALGGMLWGRRDVRVPFGRAVS